MTASKPELNHSNFTATPVSKKIPQRQGGRKRVQEEEGQKPKELKKKKNKNWSVGAKVGKVELIQVVGIIFLHSGHQWHGL